MEDKSNLYKGLALVDAGDYSNAIELLLPYAEKGNIDAQSKVGFLYQTGIGVQRNILRAIELLQAAAEQGSGEAAHNLGTLYTTCEPDIPVDAEKSIYWYRKAKELGFIVSTDPDWFEKTRTKL